MNCDYERAIFLTFDLDWASDEIINDTLDILKSEGVKATFFITHATDLLGEMRKNPNFELGIHPNFNPLLHAETGRSYKHITEDLLRLVPEAKAVRSHALVQSSLLLDCFASCGLTIDANLFIPMHSGIICHPFLCWNSMIRTPYFWEDDTHCLEMRCGITKSWDVIPFLSHEGLKIFDFHPIHIFLNTEDLARYESAKENLNNKEKLSVQRFNGIYGTRIFLLDLIRKAKACGYQAKTIGEISL